MENLVSLLLLQRRPFTDVYLHLHLHHRHQKEHLELPRTAWPQATGLCMLLPSSQFPDASMHRQTDQWFISARHWRRERKKIHAQHPTRAGAALQAETKGHSHMANSTRGELENLEMSIYTKFSMRFAYCIAGPGGCLTALN